MKNNLYKITFLFLVTMCFGADLFAQSESSERKGFKKDHLFSGGGVTVSFSDDGTILGANPVLGYSLAKWIDAGISFNFIYASTRHLIYNYLDQSGNVLYSVRTDDKGRETIYGPGIFVKFYPVKFLFLQGQLEKNFITKKYIHINGSPTDKERFSPTSFLVGAGYCQGREDSDDVFYYFSVMVDIAKNYNSPYVEQISDGSVNILPIVRAGIQIPLFRRGGSMQKGD